MIRSLVRAVTVLAVIATGLVVPTVVDGPQGTPAGTAQAADLRFFDPGNIISDAVFYDSMAMSTADVQYFLDLKGVNCVDGEMPCLKRYGQATSSRAATSFCGAFPGSGWDSAATIITKVAVACGISPRVLLVILQKERGLVTATKPLARSYEIAMGMGCPDTAACNTLYYGFANQVYSAAAQYRRYQVNANSYGYVAGRNNTIGWHPNGGCGSSSVWIANQATAGLYNYTPYRPNQAALNAGYGTGDGCSSYGNRNFWNYFTDWFGSTQSSEGAALYGKYQSLGGSTGSLGTVQSPYLCGLANGGCFQVFQKGVIYWTPGTGAWAITGAIQEKWGALGREWGALGYPLSDANCGLAAGGCYQLFERGTMYWTATTGASGVYGAVGSKWISTGAENGALGYPVGDQGCGLRDGGCYQPFQRGLVYWTAGTGARIVTGEMATKWGALGRENGALGYPVTDRACGLIASGCYQIFQYGTVYTAPAAGTYVAKGGIGYTWMSGGAENGPLGYPVGDETCGLPQGGCAQDFQRGSIFWSGSTGAHVVSGVTRDKYNAVGRERGILGYPAMKMACGLVRGGCYQVFQYGTIYQAPGGAYIAKGGLGHTWMLLGAENGSMGYPVSDEGCGLRENGCFQLFENGSVYYAPAFGAFAVEGPIRDAWLAQGLENGWWGYPTGKLQTTATGSTQRFERGTATWTSASGTVTFG